MVAMQKFFGWYEKVEPPDDARKTVHVRNHWRSPPRRYSSQIPPAGPANGDNGVRPVVTVKRLP